MGGAAKRILELGGGLTASICVHLRFQNIWLRLDHPVIQLFNSLFFCAFLISGTANPLKLRQLQRFCLTDTCDEFIALGLRHSGRQDRYRKG